jgi:hypothetical protein
MLWAQSSWQDERAQFAEETHRATCPAHQLAAQVLLHAAQWVASKAEEAERSPDAGVAP